MEAYSHLLLFVPLLLLLLCRRWRQGGSLRLPPSPRSLPIIGHLHLLGRLPHRSLARLAELHGPLMLLRLGRVPVVVVSSPEAARHVLKTHDLAFSGRSQLIAGDRFSYGSRSVAFSPYGETWRFLRRVSMLEIFAQKRVAAFHGIRLEEADHFGSAIAAAAASAGGCANLTELFFGYVSNILYRELFGMRAGGGGDGDGELRLQDLVVGAFSLISGFCFGDLFPSLRWVGYLSGMEAKLNRCLRGVDKVLERELDDADRRRQPCFAVTLLDMQRDPQLGFPLTRDHIKAVLMDMFLGGTDTSAVALEWAMAELMRDPKKLRRAQAEVRGARASVEKGDLEDLGYLKAVVKETLRLHPPIALPLPRETQEACEVDGYHVPAGTRVFLNVWAIGRDARHWDSPGEFVPERFEEGGAGQELDYGGNGQQFRLLPFGGGRRVCPGIALSVVAMELCLATMLLRFDWELPEGVDDLDMEEVAGLSIRRRTPLLLRPILPT